MDIKDILSCVDHTNLSVTADWAAIRRTIDEGIKYGAASCCVPPSYVRDAVRYADRRIKICTVVGFPNGYSTTDTKCYEAANAIEAGAEEIDVVVNLGWVKDGRYADVLDELRDLRYECKDVVLKVIIETSLLTDEEKVAMCHIVSEIGVDFIKTSTGFAGGGATVDDVNLLKNNIDGSVQVKASGGISSIEDAEALINAGASRLGTSKVIKSIAAAESEG